jgi:hypothetical protein
LGDLAVGNRDDGALHIPNYGAAQRQVLDASHHASDPDTFSDRKLIFNDDEKAVDEIAHQMLSAKAECQARQSSGRRNGRDVESKLRQRRQNRSDQDDRRSGAVQKPGQGLYMLLAHPRDPAQTLGPGSRNQAARQHPQHPVQNQGDQENRGESNPVTRLKIRPFDRI